MRRSQRDAEPTDEAVTERVSVRRETLPSARAILWKPLPDSYHLLASMMRTTEQQMQLFITQRAFLQVERHLGSAPELELGGFLAGYLYECPRTRARYSIVNTVVPFAEVTGDPIGVRVTDMAYKAVRTRLDAHGLFLIGWYRNGSGLGLQLLPDDIETHLTYFEKPWQTTMLVVSNASKPKGAFFTYDPRVGRSYCIPFYELFDATAVPDERLGRTCVTWKTYVPSSLVQPLPAEEREIVETTIRPMRSEPEPESTEPIDEWLDAIKDPWVRLRDVAIAAKRRDDEPMPVVWQPTGRAPGSLSAPVEPPQRPSVSVRDQRVADEPTAVARPRSVDAPNGSAATPAHALPVEAPNGPAATPTRLLPPFAGPARPGAKPATRPERVASPSDHQPLPARQLPPIQTAPVQSAPVQSAPVQSAPVQSPPVTPPPVQAAPRPQAPPRRSAPAPRKIPAATAAAMARAATPPAVALPPSFHEDAIRWRRRRRIGLAVAAASFLAVIVLSTVHSRPQQVAQAATGNGGADTMLESQGSTAVLSASEGTPAPLPLASAVDSLSRAITYYRDIEEDHTRGLVGCRVLDRAHALVVRARTRVDSSRSRVGGSLDAADSLRVSMLGAEYTHITQMYRRSGCQS